MITFTTLAVGLLLITAQILLEALRVVVRRESQALQCLSRVEGVYPKYRHE